MVVVVIESNNDMPACLNTDTKQRRLAIEIAEKHFEKSAKSAKGPRIQGFFSRTMFVTFKDGTQIVIQFRPEPLDISPFHSARQALGPIVPDIGHIRHETLESNGINTYYMTMMPGKIWSTAVAGRKPEALPAINKSLGQIFANGYVDNTSNGVVDAQLRPHLDLILKSDFEHIKPFQNKAKELSRKIEKLKTLPLWITHFDLNEMNVLVDDDFQVSGLVDWELSFPQPFGLFLGRIHTLAGEFSDGEFVELPGFEQSERALWDALYEDVATKAPHSAFKTIRDNPELVQLAVELGTLLGAFELDEGELMKDGNKATLKALPKFLTYRVPFVRGNAPPYLASTAKSGS